MTLTYELIGKGDNVNIYLRLSIDRKNVYRRKTGFTINPDKWSTKTKLPKPTDAYLKVLKTSLEHIKTEVEEEYNRAMLSGLVIDSEWLQDAIDKAQGKSKKTELDRLINYFEYYINNLPTKVKTNGKKGVSKSTIQKYSTLRLKIIDFEKHTKKHYLVKDVNLKFRNSFVDYMRNVEHLSDNYTGRLITFLKTVCRDADTNGIEISPQLNKIKGYSVDIEKIFLSFEELEQIENTTFEREALENAKDWLILGCYIGQRVSDLLPLTSDNISVKNGVELIELTQQKTGKRIAIPLHPKVKEILEKRNGEFPRKISKPKFNIHIKDVAEIAGINQKIQGSLTVVKTINGKITQRKEHGTYKKYQLVTSHICRRSFASNFYGDIPTALLISITGHSTEKQFLGYIGKSETDQAQQLAEYWTREALRAKKEPQMKVKYGKAN